MDIDYINEQYASLQSQGRYDDLIELLREAITLHPKAIDLRLKLAATYRVQGNPTSAVDSLRMARAQDEEHVLTFVMLADLRAAELTDCMKLQAKPNLSAQDQIALKHAEAKILEQHGQFDQSFEAYRRAKEWSAVQGPDFDRVVAGARSVLADISLDLVRRYEGRGNPSDKPVFIVGMPRSGTTLTEQIIDQHPKVFALGEQQVWGQVLSRLVRAAVGTTQPMIPAINDLSDHIWRSAGEQYLAPFQQSGNGFARIVDKLPGNYGLLPYIRLIFPNARVIHLRRHPLATLYSCIRQNFTAPGLSLSVTDWARQYGVYRTLMRAWAPILQDQMLTIDYEDLVSDLPTVARQLVEFLGLKWNDACLYPEKNQRLVTTASVLQVREPVHTGSIESWRRCQAQMEALLPVIEETENSLRAT